MANIFSDLVTNTLGLYKNGLLNKTINTNDPNKSYGSFLGGSVKTNIELPSNTIKNDKGEVIAKDEISISTEKMNMQPNFSTTPLYSIKKDIGTGPTYPVYSIKKDIGTGPTYPDITTPKIETDKLSLEDKSNIYSGLNAVGSQIGAWIGNEGLQNMRPAIAGYQEAVPPLKLERVRDRSLEIQSAGKENIASSANAARRSAERQGIAYMGNVINTQTAKAENELGSNIAQYRAGIDTANAQIANEESKLPWQAEINREQFNSQVSATNAGIQNQFDMWKSQQIGKNMSYAAGQGQQAVKDILANNAYMRAKQEGELLSKMKSAQDAYNVAGNDINARDIAMRELESIQNEYNQFIKQNYNYR